MTNQESNQLWPRIKTCLVRSIKSRLSKKLMLRSRFRSIYSEPRLFRRMQIGIFYSTVNMLNPFVVTHYDNFDRNKSISFHYHLSLKIKMWSMYYVSWQRMLQNGVGTRHQDLSLNICSCGLSNGFARPKWARFVRCVAPKS